MSEMTLRENFHAVLNFEPFERLPVIEWAHYWDKTVDRWHGEGLPDEVSTHEDVLNHFGVDIMRLNWVRSHKDIHPARHNTKRVIGNIDDYMKVRDQCYRWPVVDHDLWKAWAAEQKKGNVVLWFSVDGFFWYPRGMLGIEDHLFAFYDEPELLHMLNKDQAEHSLKVIDEICSICTPDFMTFAEDMSYNNGPMLSEVQFKEFLTPYYEKVVPRIKEHGVRVFVDSDGDVTMPAQWFLDAGIEGLLPLERQAGVDVAELRKNHPDLLMMGAFDKMTMPKGEEAMRAEFERLLTTARGGGFLISCDHQTPPGVSMENYKIYLRLFNEYALKAGSGSLCSR